MPHYRIRPIREMDFAAAAAVYSSNADFLINHLGVEQIDEIFIAEEAGQMRKIGFQPCVIAGLDGTNIYGVLDYRPGTEAYLSLLLIDRNRQGQGIGSSVYSEFECRMRETGSSSVRIDVVTEHAENALFFWKKHGFNACGQIGLNWGKKQNMAVVMRKYIQ